MDALDIFFICAVVAVLTCVSLYLLIILSYFTYCMIVTTHEFIRRKFNGHKNSV